MNRNVNVAIPTLAQRQASDPLMPGGADADPQPRGARICCRARPMWMRPMAQRRIEHRLLWNDALRAGLTVGIMASLSIPIATTSRVARSAAHDPFATGPSFLRRAMLRWRPSPISTSAASIPPFRLLRFTEWERTSMPTTPPADCESDPGSLHARSHRSFARRLTE